MITEEWKDIKGYEGIYKISNFGNVMRFYKTKTRLMHPTNGKAGYPLIALSKHNKRKLYTVHRLVAEAFIPKVRGKKYIDHIDGNRSNNNVSNLRWCTFKENCRFPIAVKNRQDSHAKSCGIPVAQYDSNGNEINRFASIAEAERFTGIWKTNIHRALKGLTNKAGGYIWKRF